jgi:hypothetical protein
MDVVEKTGAVLAGSRVDLVENQLAIVSTPERVDFVRREFARAPPEIRRLAIGDPAAVPAGVYARRYLEQRGLWVAYEARIVPTTNVRAALGAVETGSVDAAICTSPILPPPARPSWRSRLPRRAPHRLSGRRLSASRNQAGPGGCSSCSYAARPPQQSSARHKFRAAGRIAVDVWRLRASRC